jgi:hypothetical protein
VRPRRGAAGFKTHGLCRGLGEQFGQSDEIVGGHGEGELPIDLGQSAMMQFAHAADRLGPAEGFFDAFADALRYDVAGVAGEERRKRDPQRPCHLITARSRYY